MKNMYLLAGFACALMVSACGGDSGSSASDNGEKEIPASSSVEQNNLSSSEENVAVESSSSSDVDEKISSDSNEQQGAESSSSAEKVIPSSSSVNQVSNYDPVTGLLTDERDGNVYRTAKVGNQIWMAQNLRLEDPNIVEGCSSNYYDYSVTDEMVLQKYGHHYGWITAMQLPCEYDEKLTYSGTDSLYHQPHQGLCPTGWHVPSIAEWQELLNTAPLTQLLSTDWNKRYFVGTDDYGFSLNIANRDEENLPEFLVIDEASPDRNYALVVYCADPDEPIKIESETKWSIFTYLRCVKD